jgi:hypothetical protein
MNLYTFLDCAFLAYAFVGAFRAFRLFDVFLANKRFMDASFPLQLWPRSTFGERPR